MTDLAKRLRVLEGTGVKPHITQLLAVFGMELKAPRKQKFKFLQTRRHGFWEREHGNLYYILKEAHDRYRALCKEVRPDLVENHDQAVKLNAAWTQTKVLFERHGVSL